MPSTESNSEGVVTINFGALLRRAERSLTAVANNAAFGVIASASVPENAVHMPGALMQLCPSANSAELAIHFPRWISGIAFREYITQLGGFLEETGCTISLVKRSQQPGAEWNLETVWQQINRKSLPDKLRLLEDEMQVCLHAALRRDIESINRARNCFEHRRGIVTKKDAPSGCLEVTWRAMQFLEKRTDGEEVVIHNLPYETKEGSSIIGRAVEKRKSFNVGSVLEFTGPEIWEIGVSLVAAVKKITAEVQEFAKPHASVVREQEAMPDRAVAHENSVKMADFEMTLYPDDET